MISSWACDVSGFLNRYATRGVEEDKAEIYGCLIVLRGQVQRRTEKEPVLALKVARLKELLHRFYGELDRSFWKRAEKRWKKKADDHDTR